MDITDQDIEMFRNQGAILLKGVISSDWVEKIKTGITKNKEYPSQFSENLRSPEGPGYYFNDYCNWKQIDQFRDFVYNSGAANIAAKLMRSKKAIFYHEHVLTKDANTYKRTPWHQDQPYYPIDGFQNCSMWIPVDSVSLESSIQFISGSHRWGKWYHPRKFATSNKYIVENRDKTDRVYEDIPDFDDKNNAFKILKWACEPGDCVIFHMLTVHGAPENLMTSARRVVSFRWLGDDAILAERPWTVSPPITGGLTPGDHMTCDAFPVVWEEQKRE